MDKLGETTEKKPSLWQYWWQKLTHLGVHRLPGPIARRRVLLVNRLSLLIAFICLLAFLSESAYFLSQGVNPIGWVSIRMPILVAVNLLHLYLNYKGLYRYAKGSLVFSNLFFNLQYPLMVGSVFEVYYFWYPYIAIGISVIPHLIFSIYKDRYLFFSAIALCALYVIFSSEILDYYGGAQLEIRDIIQPSYSIYKFAILAIYAFTNLTVMYLQNLNRFYEKQMEQASAELSYKTKLIHQQAHQLEAQNEELKVQHEELRTLNEHLEERVQERTQSLEKQNEQLKEHAFIHAHLLRAPLCRVKGLVQLLNYYEKPNDSEDVMKHLNRSTQELDALMEAIRHSLEDGDALDREDFLLKVLGDKITLSKVESRFP